MDEGEDFFSPPTTSRIFTANYDHREACPCCGGPIFEGEEVHFVDEVLCHANCEEAE